MFEDFEPTDVPSAVSRGMKFMDSVAPGWEAKINLDTLDISDSPNCVLGQVFEAEAARHPFTSSGYGYGRAVLRAPVGAGFAGGRTETEEWRNRILARRAIAAAHAAALALEPETAHV